MGSILTGKGRATRSARRNTNREQSEPCRRSARRRPASSTRAIYEPTTGRGNRLRDGRAVVPLIAEPPAVLPFLRSVRSRFDRATESSRAQHPVESLSIWSCSRKRRRTCRSRHVVAFGHRSDYRAAHRAGEEKPKAPQGTGASEREGSCVSATTARGKKATTSQRPDSSGSG